MFRAAPLLDAYDVYQHLMDYWAKTMQDDVYLLVREGWKAELESGPNTELIPTRLIVARYFAAEQSAITQLEAERDAITLGLEEIEEEHGGEDGLLAEAKTDKGNLTAKSVNERLKAIKGDETFSDERSILDKVSSLFKQESEAAKKVNEARGTLDVNVAAKYGQLTEAENRGPDRGRQWLTALAAVVRTELDARRSN